VPSSTAGTLAAGTLARELLQRELLQWELLQWELLQWELLQDELGSNNHRGGTSCTDARFGLAWTRRLGVYFKMI
jgi:hypothetical protein